MFLFNPKIYPIKSNKIILKTNAIISPNRCPLFLTSAGSFWVTMEIKIILSTPSIISKKVSVAKLIQVAGSKKMLKSI